MAFEFLVRQVRLAGFSQPVDIAFSEGRIAALGPDIASDAPAWRADGRFACAGLTEAHIHLDKAGIVGRCRLAAGTLAEAVSETARAKADFTEEDVYRRARKVVEQAVAQGTNRMRSFVEIDPRAGFRSFEAIKAIRRDYAWAIDIELCAFAQDGLTDEPATEVMLDHALANGADLVGGCPYTDRDPAMHIERIFALAEKHKVAVDFHLDFDLDPSQAWLPRVIAETIRRDWGGRVSVGHVTKLSAMPPDHVKSLGVQLVEAGVAVTVLPATDLYLTGRDRATLVPRGVAPAHFLSEQGVVTAIATNNVLNPFTPFGDLSLVRMANLYATVAQRGSDEDLTRIFAMISSSADRLLTGVARRVEVGSPADLVIFEAHSASGVVGEIAQSWAGWKKGRLSFLRPAPRLFPVSRETADTFQLQQMSFGGEAIATGIAAQFAAGGQHAVTGNQQG